MGYIDAVPYSVPGYVLASHPSDLGEQLADQSGRPAGIRPTPRRLIVNLVLGNGEVIGHRVELGEVLRLSDPEGELAALAAGHWFGIEVTER